MKKNIAIITGGDSSEIVISLRSAEQVKNVISPKLYVPYIVFIQKDNWHVKLEGDEIPVDRHSFSFRKKGQKISFDYAFFAMHGPPGEDGRLQAYFDLLHIPYSTSGVLSLALSFNKFTCKMYLKQFGIQSAKAVLLKKKDTIDPNLIIQEVRLPCFIKPNKGGSSFGVSKILEKERLLPAIQSALKEDDEVIIEEYLKGKELTCGLVKTSDRELIFPVTEVVSKKEFFDYEAKYTKGMANEITPARISEELTLECQSTASRIYDLLDCHGIIRVDFICGDNRLFFLEVNGIPGMTKESIVPQQIRAHGLTEAEVYNLIIKDTAGWS